MKEDYFVIINGSVMKHMDSNFAKLDKFEGVDFRRWQKKMHLFLSSMSVVYVLTTPLPEDGGDDATVEQIRKRAMWDNDDYVCRGLILNDMSDSLFDIYQNDESSKDLWDSLEAKYMVDDASSDPVIPLPLYPRDGEPSFIFSKGSDWSDGNISTLIHSSKRVFAKLDVSFFSAFLLSGTRVGGFYGGNTCSSMARIVNKKDLSSLSHVLVYKVPFKRCFISWSSIKEVISSMDMIWGSKKASWVIWNNVLTDKKRGWQIIRLESSKDVTVSSKIGDTSLVCSFRRIPRGGIEQNQFDSLVELVRSVTIVPSADRWNWNLESTGNLRGVASLR
ncbi:hypothetical protein Tco_1236542 [Tanacetum coccineum]